MIPVLGFVSPGWQELLIILALVLIVFGPRKLPEIADALGKSINKFKSATRGATDDVKRELDDARRAATEEEPPDGTERPGETERPREEADQTRER
jgi:TatA/E family protein of Tat protein translocase